MDNHGSVKNDAILPFFIVLVNIFHVSLLVLVHQDESPRFLCNRLLFYNTIYISLSFQVVFSFYYSPKSFRWSVINAFCHSRHTMSPFSRFKPGTYQRETPTVYEWRHYDGFKQLS